MYEKELYENVFEDDGYYYTICDFKKVMELLKYSQVEIEKVYQSIRKIHIKYFKKLIENGFDIGEEDFVNYKDSDFLTNKSFLDKYENNHFNCVEIALNDYFLDRIFDKSYKTNYKERINYILNSKDDEDKKEKQFLKNHKKEIDLYISIMDEFFKEKNEFIISLWEKLFDKIQKNCIYLKSIDKRNKPLKLFEDKEFVYNYVLDDLYEFDVESPAFYNKDDVFKVFDYLIVKEMNEHNSHNQHHYKIYKLNDAIVVVFYGNEKNEGINSKVALQIFV